LNKPDRYLLAVLLERLVEDARNGDQAILVVPTDGREAVYRIERWLRVAGAWVIDDEVDLLIKEPS
jgi:hypothetical protein